MANLTMTARNENNFKYHEPKGDQAERYIKIRDTAKSLANLICDLVPEGRELSISMTKIEECVFWANAGIARNE